MTGAGPAVYGLFDDASVAVAAEARVRSRGRTWILRPKW